MGSYFFIYFLKIDDGSTDFFFTMTYYVRKV